MIEKSIFFIRAVLTKSRVTSIHNVKTIPKILLRIQFYHILQSYLVNNGVMDIAECFGHSREMVENYYFSYVS